MRIFGPPNVEKLKTKKDIKGLIKALGYQKRWKVRQDAAWALGVIGDPRAVEPLLILLNDKEWIVQNQAKMALGKIGNARAVKPLIVNLKHENGFVDETAVDALGKIGNVRALKPLIKALEYDNNQTRAHIAIALSKIGDIEVLNSLIIALDKAYKEFHKDFPPYLNFHHLSIDDKNLFDRKARNIDTIQGVIKTTVKTDEKRGVELLINDLRNENLCPDTRLFIAKILGDIGDIRSIKPLVDSFNLDFKWGFGITKALAKIGGEAVETLIIALKDTRPTVREAAPRALGKIGDVRAVQPLIATLKDTNPKVREISVEALGEIGDVRAVKPLIATLKDTSPRVRENSVEALGKIGNVRAVEPVIATLDDTDYKVRLSAAQVLGEIGDTRAVEPLIKRLHFDGIADVIDKAAWTLVKLYDKKKLDTYSKKRIYDERHKIHLRTINPVIHKR